MDAEQFALGRDRWRGCAHRYASKTCAIQYMRIAHKQQLLPMLNVRLGNSKFLIGAMKKNNIIEFKCELCESPLSELNGGRCITCSKIVCKSHLVFLNE